MKTDLSARNVVKVTGALLAFVNCLAQAPFDSGSNGSMGDLKVPTNTVLEMPADGIFHYNSITIALQRS
jgi:hypothetical protein